MITAATSPHPDADLADRILDAMLECELEADLAAMIAIEAHGKPRRKRTADRRPAKRAA
ncbi:hypothetical protein NKJ26_03200 [Mesorhizobium sp. M0152]|uniref:hypothetical protein n=1 Tax=Mesorhizobium sp. M0152 TaxID=2956898 RepID=UPI0033392123